MKIALKMFTTRSMTQKSDIQLATEYRIKLYLLVYLYNAVVILCMSGLIYYFENGWPALMIFLLNSVEHNNDNRKSDIQ